ncbi:MAG: hypothetical protein IT438_04470 [Phycisphaerales bacterium]|nr:hypothetical protein [Phycisphaerales bacterium]
MKPTASGDGEDLVRYLSTRDVSCPACGYNLRGLTADKCPECNQHLELRVALSEPRLGPYLAAMLGLLAGGGAAFVVVVGAVCISMVQGWPRPDMTWTVFGLPSVMSVVLLVLAAWLLRSRPWFRGLSRAGRGWTIGGCWGLTAMFLAWFLISVAHLA